MKKLYIHTLIAFISLMFFAKNNSIAQVITITDVPTDLCANESFSLSYTVSGMTINPTNIFAAEISDINGVFPGIPIIISNETFSSATIGTVYVTIPHNTTLNPTSKYRIRIKASNTSNGVATSSDNGADIIVNCTTRDYYWYGGTGNWSDFANHWKYTDDGGNTFPLAFEVPLPNDNANFDANSFPSGGTLTFDQSVDINDFYWEPGSGAANPVIENNWNTLYLNGEFVLDAGVITNFGGIQFNSSKKNIEINYGDNILSSTDVGRVLFNGGGSWDLNSEMTAGYIELYNGSTFSTNDYQVNLTGIGSLWSQDASNTINTGFSEIYLSSLEPNGMNIYDGGTTWYFNGGGIIESTLSLNEVIIESGNYNINGSNTFNELILYTGTSISFPNALLQTILVNFEAIGTRSQLVNIQSTSAGATAMLNVVGSTVNVDFAIIKDIVISGDNSPYLADNSFDDGINNSGWTFNSLTPLDYYWVGGSGDWSDNLAHWSDSPSGGNFRVSPPGAIDNIYFTSNSFPSGGTISINTNVECDIMEWQAGSGDTNPKILASSNSLTINGDFTLDGGVIREIQDLFFEASFGQTQNINFGDNSFEGGGIFLNGGGTWELLSDLSTGNLHLREGTFNSNNNQINVEYLVFWDNQTSNWGSSIVNISNGMTNNTTATPKLMNSGTFNFTPESNWSTTLNGGFILNDAVFTGIARINDDNFYNNLTFLPGGDITLEANTTQTIAGGTFTADGLRDQPISIKSNSDGVQATISQAIGTINTEYLKLQDSNATGIFNASNYTNNGNVTGWNLISPVVPDDFYWIGGTGEWSDNTNWSEGDGDLINIQSNAPGINDNAIFTSNSFSATGQIVTIDNSAEITNLTWLPGSGVNTPSISNGWNTNLTIHGNLIFDNGVQRNLGSINFNSSSNTNLINFADNLGGENNGSFSFTGGGEWELQSNIQFSSLDIGDATLRTMGMELSGFSINLNDATGLLNLATSDVYITSVNNSSGAVGAIVAGTSTIFINEDEPNYGFSGNLILNNVQVLNGGSFNVEGDLSVNNLTLLAGSSLKIIQGVTLTTNSMSALGTASNPIRIKSDQTGSQGFISQAAGTVNADFLLISDNWAQGGATFINTNSVDAGNAGGLWLPINTTAPKNYFWVGGSGNWSDAANHWVNSDGGSTFYSEPPGIADNAFFTSSSFTGADEKVIIDQPAFCNDMTWSTTLLQSPTLFGTFDLPLKVFGSFVLTNGVHRNVAELIFESYNSGNIIDMADNLRGSFAQIDFQGSGEWTLANAFEAESVEFGGGTFNTDGFTLRVDKWSFENKETMTFNAGSSHIYTSSFYNNASSSTLNFDKGTSTIHIVKTQESNNEIYGPFNLNDVIIEADVTIWRANSFNSLTVNDGVKVELSSDDIQLISDLALNGLANTPIIIESTYSGSQGIFSVPSNGTVVADYVILTDNNATGGAVFQPITVGSITQVSNVTGWSGVLQGQTITFPNLDDITLAETLNLSATSSSGLAITYSIVPITGTATVSTSVLTPVSSGLVAIVASQAGNGTTIGMAQEVTQYVHLNIGDFPNELGQMKQASYVVGTPNGVSEGGGNPSNNNLPYVMQSIVSPDGKLIASGLGRVMIWNQLPDAYDVPADVVVGQADFTSLSQSASQSTLAFPTDLPFTGSVTLGPTGQLIVSDGRGVMIWDSIPTTNGAPADVVIGQLNFTSTSMAIAQDKFITPFGVAVSTDGELIISDFSANRVLIYNTIPTSNGAFADVVIGQPDFTSSTPGTSQKDLAFPGLISVSPDNKLLIADLANNRILIYNTIPKTNYASADVVIGQPDFISNSSGTSGTAMTFPMMASISKTGKLAISDWNNRRVLIYNQIPADNTISADLVLGQPDLTTNNLVNQDDITLRVMGAPFGVAWDNVENLLITDSGFDGLSRIMVYGEKDITAPSSFTVGEVATLGGTVVNNYWNASNTSVNVSVPIANDLTLSGGTIQTLVKIGTGTIETIGASQVILDSNLGGVKIMNVTDAELMAATDYAQDLTIWFGAILTDIGNNQTIGAESITTITIDTSAPISFTTGTVVSVGGTTVSGYWNSTNTSIEINTPIDNDASLIGGSFQIQAKIGTGNFTDIGSQVAIASGDLGVTLITSILSAELIALPDYTEGENILFRTILEDVASNQTISTESASTTLIDTTNPPLFSVDNIAVTGGTIISGIWNSTNTALGITVPVENEPSITGGTIQLQVRFGAAAFIDIELPYTVALSDLGTNKTINISKAVFEAATGYLQGQTVEFNAIKTDIAGNQTTGTLSGATLLINESATVVFTTGAALTVGGVITTNYYNESNTSIEIEVPIQNDPTLDGGSVQMQVKIGAGPFVDVGNSTTITTSDLGNSIIIVLTKAQIEALTDFTQGSNIIFRAFINNNLGNQIVGAESNSTFIIDTVEPVDFIATIEIVGQTSTAAVQGFWNSNTTAISFSIPIDNDATLEGGFIQLQIDVNENGYTNIENQYTIAIGDLSNTVNLTINKTSFEAASGISEGSEVEFKVIITDVAGNSTEGTISNNFIIVDRVAPEINSTLPTTYISNSGTSLIIDFANNDSGIENVFVHYHFITKPNDAAEQWEFVELTAETDGTYSFDLSIIDSNNEKLGIEYYVRGNDKAANQFTTISNIVAANIRYPNGVTISNYGVGNATENYRLFSIPANMDNLTINSAFSNLIGNTYDASKMRVFSYAGGNTTTYDEAGENNFLNLEIGSGYFGLAASGSASSTTSGAAETTFPVSKTLVNGWNLIGNPYGFDIPWTDVLTNSGLTTELATPISYNGTSSWPEQTILKTGKGYFVNNTSGSSVTINFPLLNVTGGRFASAIEENHNSLEEDSWEVKFLINAKNGNRISIGGIGMEIDAESSIDYHDRINPPAFSNQESMIFNHPEYFQNSFRNDIRPLANQEKWDFEYALENTGNQKQELHWDNSYYEINSPDLFLVDKTHFATINMKEQSSYTFNHTDITKFEIYFGYDISEQILPAELITQSPFPNPFTRDILFNIGLPKGDNYSIEIRIFNSIGQEIENIKTTDFDPGYTSISWNGIDRNGSYIPAGIYNYTIHIKGNSIDVIETGKIIKQNN